MSQDRFSEQNGRLTVGGAMAQSLGQKLGQVSEELIRKQMNVAPTIKIRPGYRFNVQVTKDVTFNGPYHEFDYQRSMAAGSRTFRASK
jgi:type IV secretion system protein VirB10